MSRNIHDVERHGTLMVQVDENAPRIWNKVATAFGTGLSRLSSVFDLTPEQHSRLRTVVDMMEGYSDEDLESMARIGERAALALELRKSRPNVTQDQVDRVCQQITRR
ncbi:hypothetical protein MPK71_gp203 [Erwinia phage pEa_SNUABM_1]|uniref:Uncharacterized protein n=1 Tax=Erwinia phage pEa_SNUABM_1 TaxID=2869543 RepID=A0AAE7XJK0_9CAUD|nr:hypothetical protein MPK71_gp203 [Erwinia phage pEa_SNUABM_1]QZE57412.1 hypothetical protein pEaSNUABM1_00203 [Erwinia phage pEa_SNUABM_1]